MNTYTINHHPHVPKTEAANSMDEPIAFDRAQKKTLIDGIQKNKFEKLVLHIYNYLSTNFLLDFFGHSIPSEIRTKKLAWITRFEFKPQDFVGDGKESLKRMSDKWTAHCILACM